MIFPRALISPYIADSASNPQSAYAQLNEFKLTAGDAAADDSFGGSVSISGDYAVVGASLDGDNGTASGSAHLFKRSDTSWIEEIKLLASDGATTDRFGSTVNISADYAVVGALGDDNENGSGLGSAYLYNLQDPFAVRRILK